jgi:two-component system, cell cycle sensor histidine kinase and response regulator CckA
VNLDADGLPVSLSAANGPVRLLFLDDESDVAAVVADALLAAGMSFTLAAAADWGCLDRKWDLGSFDVVLCDVTASGAAGLSVVEVVRGQRPHLPVIVLLGSASAELAVTAMKHGAADTVLKQPPHLGQLPLIIRAALERGRLRAELAGSQRALQASEAFYRSLVDSLPQSVFRKDREGRFTFGNRQWCETLGKTPAEFIGQTDADFYPPGLARKYRADDRRVMETGQPYAAVEAHTTLSGAELRVRTVKTPLRDDRGQVIGIQGIFWDETDRWQAEQQVNKTVTLLQATLESTSDAILVVDNDRKVVSHNLLFATMWGIPESLLALRDAGKLLEFVVEQLAEPAAFRQKVEALYAEPEATSFDELRFKDGRLFERYSRPYRLGGQPAGRVWSFRDVTERTQVETALRRERDLLQALMNNLPDTVYFKDAQSRFIRINRGQARALGLASPAEAAGKTDADFFNPEHAQAALADEQRILATGEPMIDKLEWLRRPDGAWRWISATKVPMRDGTGRIVGTMGMSRDITERKEAEEQHRALERKLLEVQKLESLGVMAGGIAHDFNNLLTGIVGNAGLAAMELAPDSPVQHFLADIEKISLQASGLCNQMLAYAGRGRLAPQVIDLNRLIKETADLLQMSIDKKSVLQFDLTEGLVGVLADPAQVRQVILNLVVNASEAIGDQSGVITIRTGRMRADRAFLIQTHLSPDLPEGDYVYVEVSDSGCGMSAETKAKIFDPFFTTRFKGRGLGLAAVLGVVRAHRGAIKVESEVGRGTTFRLVFPGDDGAVEAPPGDADSLAGWKGTGTVLVADDEETVRMTVARMVEAFGFDPILSVDGREAVAAFRARGGAFAVVLLDMTMPHLSGLEAFREIREVNPQAKVILMSGYSEEDATSRFAGHGLDGFLHKPFRPCDLREKLHAIL